MTAVFLMDRKEVIPMSNRVRRAFVKLRPVAQTVAAFMQMIAATIHSLKDLGLF